MNDDQIDNPTTGHGGAGGGQYLATSKTPLMAGGRIMAIVPQTLEEVWRLATAICRAGMAPHGLETPDKCVIAIMQGLEVGLPPMMALQSIAVIGGRPSLFGDGALAVVRNSGKMESIRETYNITTETAICAVKRHGERTLIRTFSKADAVAAGLWGKKTRDGKPTPWISYPKRMLQMRARAFALRDGFADALRGFGIAEEQMDIPGVIEHVPTGGPPGLDEPEQPGDYEAQAAVDAADEAENEAREASGG